MTPIAVRPALATDAEMMSKVHISAWAAAYGSLLSPEFMATMNVPEWTARWRTRLATDEPLTTYLVASSGHRLVGIAAAGPSRTHASVTEGELRMLNVAEDWWSHGVGSALHSECLNHLTSHGFRGAHLWVAAENRRARSFYARHQWTQNAECRTDHRVDPPLTEVGYQRALVTHPASRPSGPQMGRSVRAV